MKRVRTAAAVAAGLVVVAIVAGSPVFAGEPPATGTITVEPPSGPSGTVFMFTGEGCVSEAAPGVVDLVVFFGEEVIESVPRGFVDVEDDGSWRVGFAEKLEAGFYDVTASCVDPETEQVLVDYDVATFEVIPGPTPPTTAPPTTMTTVAPSQASITVSPSTAAQGETVTISGNVPVAGSKVCLPGAVTLTSELFAATGGFGPQVPRDANGNFETTYTIPSDSPPGTYSIGMRCGGSNIGVRATLQVTQAAQPPTPVPAQPSFTG